MWALLSLCLGKQGLLQGMNLTRATCCVFAREREMLTSFPKTTRKVENCVCVVCFMRIWSEDLKPLSSTNLKVSKAQQPTQCNGLNKNKTLDTAKLNSEFFGLPLLRYFLMIPGFHKRIQHADGSDNAPLSDAWTAALSSVTESLQPELCQVRLQPRLCGHWLWSRLQHSRRLPQDDGRPQRLESVNSCFTVHSIPKLSKCLPCNPPIEFYCFGIINLRRIV